MWIIIAGGIAVFALVAVARQRMATDSDLGWVTERWLTEYRANHSADAK